MAPSGSACRVVGRGRGALQRVAQQARVQRSRDGCLFWEDAHPANNRVCTHLNNAHHATTQELTTASPRGTPSLAHRPGKGRAPRPRARQRRARGGSGPTARRHTAVRPAPNEEGSTSFFSFHGVKGLKRGGGPEPRPAAPPQQDAHMCSSPAGTVAQMATQFMAYTKSEKAQAKVKSPEEGETRRKEGGRLPPQASP